MKHQHLHLIGAACLLTAIILTWTSQKKPAPTPASPQLSQRPLTPKSPPKKIRITTQESKPFFDSPLYSISADGANTLKTRSSEDLKVILVSVFALPPSTRRDESIAYLLERLARVDPKAAKQQWLTWEHALTEPWLEAASKISLALAKEDPFAPSDLINKLPRTAQLATWQPILWQMDEKVAAQVLAQFPTSRETLTIAKSLSIQWMESNPEACATWLDTLIPTLSEDHRQKLKNRPHVYRVYHGSPHPDPDPLEVRLATFHQAKHPLTREYLANLILSHQKISKEQKATFTEELAEALPHYHAYLTSPERSEYQKFYTHPEEIASSLQPADFKNLDVSKQSILIDGLEKTNPEKAARFLLKMNTSRHLGSTLHHWHQVAPREAITFAQSIPTDSEYQLTLFNFAMTTAHFGQEKDTLALIDLIQSPSRQQKVRAKLAEKTN